MIDSTLEPLCTAVESLPSSVTVYDAQRRIRYVNATAARLLHRSVRECLDRTDEQLLPRPELESYLAPLRRCIESASPQRADLCLPDRLGPGAWTVRFTPVLDAGRPRWVLSIAHAASESGPGYEQLLSLHAVLEQRLAQHTAALKDRNRRLRAVAAQLSAAEQRERARIAITLHDHLQQLLVAADLAVARLMQPGPPSDPVPALRHVDSLLRQAIDASRSLTVELDPPVLREAGLAAAVEWFARRFHVRHGLDLTLDIHPDTQPDDPHIAALLFQAMRELLLNVVKHAQTDHAGVALRRRGPRVELEVEDHGRGCDAQKILAAGDESGFGLFNIQQRIVMLGGEFEVDAAPGRGCRVTVSVPVDLHADADEHEPAAEPLTPESAVATTSPERRPIRVLLADDHEMMREGIAGVLREEPDIQLVAEAADGEVAVELAKQFQPDVVIMDVSMPRMDGIAATRAIRERCPEARVIGLSMHDRREVADAMRQAGAADFLAKDRPIENVVNAIRTCRIATGV